jgi:hypothetical protein
MIKLQLDIQALEKLFPEGTEAYFHFQKAVIAEASVRFTKGLHQDVIEKIVRQHSRLAEEEILKALGAKYEGGRLYGSPTIILKDEVKRQIGASVELAMQTTIQEAITKLVPEIEQRVGKLLQVKFEYLTHTLVRTEIDKQLASSSDVIRNKLREEMEKLLGPK